MNGPTILVLILAAAYLFAGSLRVWDAWLFRKVAE